MKTLDLTTLHKMRLLPKGKDNVHLPMDFYSSVRRPVQLDLNCSEPTSLVLERFNADGEPVVQQFLAHVDGDLSVKFIADGPFSVWATGDGDVWFYSFELESFAMPETAQEVFTTIAERQARNPELEAIEARMMMNFNRRMRQQEQEIQALRLYREAEELATQVDPDERPDTGEQPAKVVTVEPVAEPPAAEPPAPAPASK